jgi:hypothetical protein
MNRISLLMPVLWAACGCTEYRFYFDCDKKINTGVYKDEGAPLDIDIVAVTEDEIKRSPQLETMTAKDWFGNPNSKNLVDRDRIWCVRGLVGGNTLRRVYEVTARHNSPIQDKSRILFFANFDVPGKDRDVIGPLTWMPHDYVVTVGEQQVNVKEGKYEGEGKPTGWKVEKCYAAEKRAKD